MRFIVLASAMAISAMPAFAAELEAASQIERVTVYPDGASVTRRAAVDLAAGASTIVLKGLPASIDAGSIRVAGEGTTAFSIGSVETRAVPGDPRPTIDAALEGRIRALRDARDATAALSEAAETKKAAIQRYAQASPEKLSPEARPLDVSQWTSAWDAIGGGLAKVNEDLRLMKAKMRELDDEIAALERARPRPVRPGLPRSDVTIALDAPVALKGTLAVTYRVAGANWQPVYDARLDTGGKAGKPSLELVRRARVTQRTGEDWNDVALDVSTVRVARGTAAPDLPPAQAQFLEPPVAYPAGAPAPRPPGLVGRGRDDAASKAEALATAAPVVAEEQQAALETGAFQASFAVPGKVSIAQDGASKSFRIASRTVAPALSVRTVPVLDETAYLEAGFVNEDEAPILPGEMAIHRDGTFVGRSRTGLVAPGDKVDLGFGVDDQVKVTRVPLRRSEREPGFLGSSKTDLREFKTTVKNLHPFPIRVTVQDRVPFSENAAIIVEMLPATTAPTEKTVSDKRGVLAWSHDYAPGEQREIRLAYRLKWPADRELVVDGARGPTPLPVR